MGLATSVALWACRAAQKRAQLEGADAWCAFVDPSRSLFAPGVAAAGVDLSRLLVVQPNFDAVDRIALKLAEARVFSTLVIDHVAESWELRTRSAVAKQLERVVRRLALAVDGTGSQVLLLTDSSVKRSSPLPVALRLELRRQGARDLWVSVAKDKRGRVQPPRRIQLETQLASAPINEPTPFVQRVA
jgi:recombination protein RecA